MDTNKMSEVALRLDPKGVYRALVETGKLTVDNFGNDVDVAYLLSEADPEGELSAQDCDVLLEYLQQLLKS